MLPTYLPAYLPSDLSLPGLKGSAAGYLDRRTGVDHLSVAFPCSLPFFLRVLRVLVLSFLRVLLRTLKTRKLCPMAVLGCRRLLSLSLSFGVFDMLTLTQPFWILLGALLESSLI
jgi:hypothetical protein